MNRRLTPTEGYVLFYSEGWTKTFLKNAYYYLPKYMTSESGRQNSSYNRTWELSISHGTRMTCLLAVQSNMGRQVQSQLNILLLMNYLTILLVYQTIQIWCHNMRIFNCSRRKGEPPWPNLGNYQRNELRKLMKNLKNDSWSLDEHPHS